MAQGLKAVGVFVLGCGLYISQGSKFYDSFEDDISKFSSSFFLSDGQSIHGVRWTRNIDLDRARRT